jgi:hypothetical protein
MRVTDGEKLLLAENKLHLGVIGVFDVGGPVIETRVRGDHDSV